MQQLTLANQRRPLIDRLRSDIRSRDRFHGYWLRYRYSLPLSQSALQTDRTSQIRGRLCRMQRKKLLRTRVTTRNGNFDVCRTCGFDIEQSEARMCDGVGTCKPASVS